MTESDIRNLSRKLDTVIECVSDIKVDVAILSEKSKHAIDETGVIRIVDTALVKHLQNCKEAAADTIRISGVNPMLIKVLIAAIIAALSALGGISLGGTL